ncbi:MAG: sulfotransferase family 2 domain-containing protein [Cyanobacteria bacterium P01_E01_bin.6]
MRMNSIEYDLGPKERLYFLHIQKTAGTTFYFTLDEKFDPDQICPARFWRQFIRLAKEDGKRLRQYRLFRGHFGYSVPQFFKRPTACVTVLRDPIKRSISHFQHICREPKDRRHKIVKAHNMDLTDFVQHPETRLAIHNLQTRSIAFDLGFKELKKIRRFAAQGVIGTPQPERSDDDLLAIAKQRLDDFPFVGIVERFQDSLFLLSYVFGWYPIRQARELNKAPKKKTLPDISPEVLETLTELNHLDIQLYHHAKQRFDEHYNQMVADLWKRYGDRASDVRPETIDDDTLFTWLERHYETRTHQRQPAPLHSIDFPFSKALAGTGWHLREGAGSGWHLPDGLNEGGTPFRWTGPETTSVVDFPLATDSDLTVKLCIIDAAAPDILDSLAMTVNDHPIELETVLKQGTLSILYGSIPQQAMDSDRAFTRLAFSVNRTTVPTLRMSDHRLVGLAFHRLQIFPDSAEIVSEDFEHYVFPVSDPLWVKTADFVATYVHPHEKLVSPGEFSKRFSKQFRSQNIPFSKKPDLNWVIIHKGMLQDVDLPSLNWAIAHMRIVFSNDVFVVLSNRADIPQSSRLSRHWIILRLQVLLLDLEHHNLLPPQTHNTFLQLSKGVSKLISRRLKHITKP